MIRLRDFPLFAILWIGASLLAFLPALNAIRLRDWDAYRAFFYHGLVFAVIGVLIGIGASGLKVRVTGRYQLATLLGVYAVFPAFLALPMLELTPTLGFAGAYFEALSSLTTTGATVFASPGEVVDAVHLWRATIGWMGGFLILLAAIAILEPMNLGGFEIAPTVTRQQTPMQRARGGAPVIRDRLLYHAKMIAPPYLVATAILAVGLIVMGEPALIAVCHAMSVLSTSGISPVEGFTSMQAGIMGEGLILFFLIFAVTHNALPYLRGQFTLSAPRTDPEIRLTLFIVAVISTFLFLRHFLAAVDVDEQADFALMARALWGTVFTVASFLTTLGMESVHWDSARDWTGLSTPGVVLLGLAMIGGGVATTAGGVKLLRVYALYKHSLRELDRLVLPRSVGGSGMTARRIRREGAYIAWIFLMLFVISVAVSLLALTLAGQPFDESLALAIAALTNTGPAAMELIPDLTYADLSAPVRAILCIAMIVGRLEALVVVALFNPDYWRR